MKMILLAGLCAVVLGFAAASILDSQQKPAHERFVTEGARVGEPGSNLVGPEWSGLNKEQPRP